VTRGLFITLEGGEGAGKTTQIARLKSALEGQGHKVITTREPGGTPGAEALRNLFIEHKGQGWPLPAQLLLMFCARALHVAQVIRPALDRGEIVICDRFTDSTRAYQGYAQGYDSDRLESVKMAAIGAFEPDLTFIFDIDPAEGLKRAGRRAGAGDTFEDKDIEFHQRLRAGFLDIARQFPDRCLIVDASKDVESIAALLSSQVMDRLR
jgi:dTMP kinase